MEGDVNIIYLFRFVGSVVSKVYHENHFFLMVLYSASNSSYLINLK